MQTSRLRHHLACRVRPILGDRLPRRQGPQACGSTRGEDATDPQRAGVGPALMARLGHASSAAALRYQHVMAGRDQAIAATLDELVLAAFALAERQPAGRSGTRVARSRPKGSGPRSR